jgi:molybdopterin-containing oxidoreductase family membrane subunit
MFEFGKNTLIILLVLLAIVFKGIFEYAQQYKQGLGVTALNNDVFWGLYITNFIFFIGVSHAGMLISAVLRITGTKWRIPIARLAEEITVLALLFGVASVLIDMGRVDRVFNMLIYWNFDSPLIWDLIAISFYLIVSVLFLYFTLIPDFAYYRDNLDPDQHKIRHWIYRILALRWRNTADQKSILEKNITWICYIIIPIAISVHTVVSWIMSMTWRVGWDSTIFGPYFVIGAIYSGLASILLVMVLFTWAYNLQEYLTKQHFANMSKLILVLAFTYLYFAISEYLTLGYKSDENDIELMEELFYGAYAGLFWFFILGGLVIPVIILFVIIFKVKILSERTILLLSFILAILINLGMWIKRYLITVPTLARPSFHEDWNLYTPNSVEVWIFASQLAAFAFLYILLSKFIPIISLWEVEDSQKGIEGK